MKVTPLILILIISFSPLAGQTTSQEFSFVRYLMERQNYDEALYVLKNLNKNISISSAQRDSIHFLKGNIYYNQKNLGRSIENFDSVSGLLPRLQSEAIFFSSFNSAFLKSHDVAWKKLFQYSVKDSSLVQLKNFELAGIALLSRNFPNYDSLSKNFTPVNYLIDQQEINLNKRFLQINDLPRKSPAVAGILSALLPGAGKFYAGNKAQGIYTMLLSGILVLQVVESYNKFGPSSFAFIAYSTVLASLYVGTIWGSVLSVKMKRNQINETINNEILLDMHIPLRTIFH